MYATFADLLIGAGKDDGIRVVLVHGVGDSFTAGNDLGDFLKNPPAAGDSPQQRLIEALVDFDKPLVAAAHGAAVGSGTTMISAENQQFILRVRSAEAKEAFEAFFTRNRAETRQ
jgi:enoyl-CoA hydratase/carnithine racemase